MTRLAEAVRPLAGRSADYDPVVEQATATRFVLLGEASHGTHEFYRERAEITKRLISEAGYTVVTAEADWPDAHRVNRYVRAESDDSSRRRRSRTSGASRPGCGGELPETYPWDV